MQIFPTNTTNNTTTYKLYYFVILIDTLPAVPTYLVSIIIILQHSNKRN